MGLPTTPRPKGIMVVVGGMLYMPQCVKPAVASKAITTKLVVPGGTLVQDSSGDSFPPLAQWGSHTLPLSPLGHNSRRVKITLSGRLEVFVERVLATWDNCAEAKIAQARNGNAVIATMLSVFIGVSFLLQFCLLRKPHYNSVRWNLHLIREASGRCRKRNRRPPRKTMLQGRDF